jgi:hypothetical protein
LSKMINHNSIVYNLAVLVCSGLLSSCGGSSSSETVTASGKAIDGYLRGATAFFDINGNGTLDSGEPSATTDANGNFSIQTTSAVAGGTPIVILVVSGTTVDMDDPSAPVTSSYSMSAPAGRYSNVTPLTTLVASYVASGQSIDQAIASVKADLNLTSLDVMADYIGKKQTDSSYDQLHNLAAATVSVLEEVAVSGSSSSLTNKLALVKARFDLSVKPGVETIKLSGSPSASKALAKTLGKATACPGLCLTLSAK